MVAPSFQTMTVVSEVYTKNGKEYIDVKNEKTGTVRSVRWYSEKEYQRTYGKTHPVPIVRKYHKVREPANVEILSVTGTNPVTIKAKVAAENKQIATVKIWQAYAAMLHNQE